MRLARAGPGRAPAFETSEEGADPSLEIFQHVGEYTDVYRAIAGRRGGQVVIGHLRRLLTELYTKRLRERVDPKREPAVPIEGVVEYLVSALIGVVQWGLERSDPATPEQLHSWFQQLVTPGVGKVEGLPRRRADPLAFPASIVIAPSVMLSGAEQTPRLSMASRARRLAFVEDPAQDRQH